MGLNAEGSIVLEYAKVPVKGQTLEFRPYLDKDRMIRWDCTGGTLSVKFRPPQCQPLTTN